jgi:glyoxylase-like metal-dependent hydrolase (beta-lactamase superfamily II)
LFAGDLVFQGSIGRTDLPGGDHSVILKSIKEKFLALPDDVVVMSGHGPDTTVGEERENNPFFEF